MLKTTLGTLKDAFDRMCDITHGRKSFLCGINFTEKEANKRASNADNSESGQENQKLRQQDKELIDKNYKLNQIVLR